MEQQHNYYAVIHASTLLDKRLSSTQKLLIALINNLSNQKGYCFASNQYLADSLCIAPVTVQQNIAHLEELKIISRVMVLDGEGNLKYRALTVIGEILSPIRGDIENNTSPYIENNTTPHIENNTIITKGSNNKLLNNKDNIGVLPILEEVKQYCLERNNGVNPEKWFDFYSSKGWMIGKNKMRDWKAAVRTWEKSEVKPQQKKYVNADGTENSW